MQASVCSENRRGIGRGCTRFDRSIRCITLALLVMMLGPGSSLATRPTTPADAAILAPAPQTPANRPVVTEGCREIETPPKWGENILASDPTLSATTPRLVALEDGRIFMGHNVDGEDYVVIRCSGDGGLTWYTCWTINYSDRLSFMDIEFAVDANTGPRLFIAMASYGADPFEWRLWVTAIDVESGSSFSSLVNDYTGGQPQIVDGAELCTDYPDYASGWYVYIAYSGANSTTVTASGHFARSTDKGSTWTGNLQLGSTEASSIGLSIDFGFDALYFTYDFAWDFSPPEIRLRQSLDFGANWPAHTVVASGFVESPQVAADRFAPSALVAYSDYGEAEREVRIKATTNRGSTWFTANPPDVPGTNLLPRMFAALGRSLFYLAWTNGDYEQVFVSSCPAGNPGAWSEPLGIVVGGAAQAYLPPAVTADPSRQDQPAVAWVDQRLTRRWSIWFATAWLDASPIEDAPAVVEGNLLVGAPNPFNPRTTLRFGLDRRQYITLAVYDVMGRRLAVLAQGDHTAGEHEVVWQGRDARGRPVPSGSYVVLLDTETGMRAQKVSLIR